MAEAADRLQEAAVGGRRSSAAEPGRSGLYCTGTGRFGGAVAAEECRPFVVEEAAVAVAVAAALMIGIVGLLRLLVRPPLPTLFSLVSLMLGLLSLLTLMMARFGGMIPLRPILVGISRYI